jgi:ribosomal-protein-serine acetyltransferase
MFKLLLGPDAHLTLIEPHHARDLNLLIKNSYEHIREWSHWLKDNNQTVGETEEWIRKNQFNFGSGLGYEIGIWHEGEMAGQIGYNYFDRENHRTEIGYWLGSSFQGKGLITRACSALINNAYDHLEIERIEIKCATKNLKSRKIPEKLGFKLEGIARNGEWLHDRFCDLAVYAMLRGEWRAREDGGSHMPRGAKDM